MNLRAFASFAPAPWRSTSARSVAALAVAVAAVVTSASSPARADGPLPSSLPAGFPALPAETVVLSNGLRVLLAPDPHARLVSIEVAYRAGSADDPNGKRGLAHVVEHFVTRRTLHIADPERTMESAGGSGFNARTSLEQTTFVVTVPPERVETALWLESDRMGFAGTALDERTLREEREVIRNEDRDRTVDGVAAAVGAYANLELYPDWHPYSAGADGAADLDAIGLADVRAFLRTWYSPANATLAIAGRFDRDKVVALVNRYFGSLASSPPPARPGFPPSESRCVLLAVQAPTLGDQIVVEWRTPAYGEQDDAALDLVARILDGPGNERFQRELVATHFVKSIWARQASSDRGSVFSVVAVAAPGVNAGLVVDRMQAVIDDLSHNVTAEELERARGIWRENALAALETTWGRAGRLVSLSKRERTPGPDFDWGFRTYEGVLARDATRVAGHWLSLDHRVATVLLSNRAAPRQGILVRREEVSR
jgi:zinc protease